MRSFLIAVALVATTMSAGRAAAQDRETGLLLLPEGQYASIPLAATPLLGDLPDEADLSSRFPRPGNQGVQGSCVGWAIAYLKDYQEGIERGWSLRSDDNRFSPAFVYNQLNRSVDCKGGTYLSSAFAILRGQGMATRTDFPYRERDCAAKPSAAVKQRARPFIVADFRRVNVQDVQEIKTQIASGFPVVIAMLVDRDFKKWQSKQPFQKTSTETGSGHAMVVVGYSNHLNAFKVINSWGEDWGDRGFGWIDYDTFTLTVREAYTAQDVVVEAAPTPDPPDDDIDVAGRVDPRPGGGFDRGAADFGQQPPRGARRRTPESIVLGAPFVSLGQNIQVTTASAVGQNSSFVPGLRIRAPGQVQGLAGRKLQIFVTFYFLNGPPLYAHPAERFYRDTAGIVTTSSQTITVGSDTEELSDVEISLPYYALNLTPTNYMQVYELTANVAVDVDGVFREQSPPGRFQFRW